MRKLIIKLFVGDYISNVFGTTINYVRASIPIWNSFLLMAYCLLDNDYPSIASVDDILSLILVGIVIFFGFIYFNFYPAKWEELDDLQKWQMGKFNITSGIKINYEEYEEWKRLDTDLKDRVENIPFWNFGYFLVNIITTIIFLITQLI